MIRIKNKKRLNIFIDESGDFGFKEKSSQLYCVSFVLNESDNDIKSDLEYLDDRLKKIGYNGMIHMSDLMANRKEYVKYSLEERLKIFWALFRFLKKTKLKVNTIIIDKKYKNKKTQLKKILKRKVQDFFENINDYMKGFNKVVIYYDNGQKGLGQIIDSLIEGRSNMKHIVEFDHKKKRVFQVADMITCIDKIIYEYKNKNAISKAEIFFFQYKDIKKIEKTLRKHRI